MPHWLLVMGRRVRPEFGGELSGGGGSIGFGFGVGVGVGVGVGEES